MTRQLLVQAHGWIEHHPKLTRGVGIAALLALSAGLYFASSDAVQLQRYGYPGIFLFTAINNALIGFPAPTSIGAAFLGGSRLNPFAVAVAAGLGAALGETTGYGVGAAGERLLPSKWLVQIAHWMQARGLITVFVLALIPNPFFDMAGISAGATRMPFWKFALACAAGKILSMLAMALTGRWLLKP